jgi:hypothetical protein
VEAEVAEQSKFDPLGILGTLDQHRVSYVVVGGLARVIQGAEEVTRGVDVVPSMRAENLRRLELALHDLGATTIKGKQPVLGEETRSPLELTTDRGELKVVPEPVGTRGYDDLRRAASREPLGSGVRPSVASLGDLGRMLAAVGRESDLERLQSLRRLAELELGRGLGL